MFKATGNGMVQDISLLEHVLDNDVGLALVFGDRDYKCNCRSCTFQSGNKKKPATVPDTNTPLQGSVAKPYPWP